MVYRSFGMMSSQAEIVAQLTRPGPHSSSGVRTYLLAKDALPRGLSAIVLRARDPLRILKTCRNPSLRAILNHRPRPESANGHFTVLVGFEGEHVVVHDPLAGPNRRILTSDLLELWQPSVGRSEITGNVLIVLAEGQQSAAPCPSCGGSIPTSVRCPGCGQSILLSPAPVLGCMNASCPERAWETLFCPLCDTVLTAVPEKDVKGPATARSAKSGERAGAAPAEIDDDPVKLKALSQEIDKFVAIVLSVNDGQPVPGTERYLTRIRELQSQMLQFQEKQAAELRARAMQPAPSAPPAPAPLPAPPPEPVAAKPPPRPPVDWNELARKLVEEIGYRPR